MDRIIKSLMTELLISLGLNSESEPKDFEKFVNYTIVAAEYSKTFDLDSITVGDGGDTGLDGVAIIVNGQLVESTEEVDGLLEMNNFLEVDYVFIQSKASSHFESSEIHLFIHGIVDFFSANPRLPRNQSVERCSEISNYLFDKAPKFRRNPNVKLYFVTTGKWLGDATLQAVIDSGVDQIEQLNLFDKVLFTPMGSRELGAVYRKNKEAISTTFCFGNKITIPPINGITQAYIGLLPFSEFLKIVSANDVLLNVFEDNVRDFQGENNDVNGGISLTLSGDDSEIFSVLNNGVTIVASSISLTGDQFTISDYQIVNGCQTSNVLYNNRNGGNIARVNVPVKVIATTDDDVKTRITLATNNQTPIKREQLAALTKFQRGLEQYYNSFSGESRIYYERRAKQFNSDDNVPKSRIITLSCQIKSFAGMFLEEPHNVTSYFGSIVKRLNEGKMPMFAENHDYIPYYTSGLAYYKLESLFKKGLVDSSYRKVKFHILMLFRIVKGAGPLPSFESKKIVKYCDSLLDILNDDNKVLKAFMDCIEIVDNSGFDKSDKQNLKLASKTKTLIEYAKGSKKKVGIDK